jgi:hypothetical protein
VAQAVTEPAIAEPVAVEPVVVEAVVARSAEVPVAVAPVAVVARPAGVPEVPAPDVRGKKKAAGKKPKLVRDSFTMPENEYQQIFKLKQCAVQGGRAVKKSELLRAGLAALSAMSVDQLLEIVNSLETIKTGRPAK